MGLMLGPLPCYGCGAIVEVHRVHYGSVEVRDAGRSRLHRCRQKEAGSPSLQKQTGSRLGPGLYDGEPGAHARSTRARR